MTGFLTTHVLDTARGCPAEGLEIALYRLQDAQSDAPSRRLIARMKTNADGRTDAHILPAEQFEIGQYELVFSCGEYFQRNQIPTSTPPFLDQIPIRFAMSEASHYHVPLLLSPYSYSTYRGS